MLNATYRIFTPTKNSNKDKNKQTRRKKTLVLKQTTLFMQDNVTIIPTKIIKNLRKQEKEFVLTPLNASCSSFIAVTKFTKRQLNSFLFCFLF